MGTSKGERKNIHGQPRSTTKPLTHHHKLWFHCDFNFCSAICQYSSEVCPSSTSLGAVGADATSGQTKLHHKLCSWVVSHQWQICSDTPARALQVWADHSFQVSQQPSQANSSCCNGSSWCSWEQVPAPLPLACGSYQPPSMAAASPLPSASQAPLAVAQSSVSHPSAALPLCWSSVRSHPSAVRIQLCPSQKWR